MKLLLTTLLLISTFCYSQKQYEFDYLIGYELTFYKDSAKITNRPFREKDETLKKYYLTNSKKNNYRAVITELDSLNYNMIFKDDNGIYSNVILSKSDFNVAEFINIDCKNITRYQNPFKYKTKYYAFFKLNDTMLNGKQYSKFKLESIKPKRTKKEQLGTQFYIIDEEMSFNLPVLDFSTAYEEWKIERNLPNGIFIETYFIDYNGYLDSKEKLINYWKIDKKIVINEDCDYTENK